jgi:hypothetical protein
MSLENIRSAVCASILMVIVPGSGMAQFGSQNCQATACELRFKTEWFANPLIDFNGAGTVYACNGWTGAVSVGFPFNTFEVSVNFAAPHEVQHTAMCHANDLAPSGKVALKTSVYLPPDIIPNKPSVEMFKRVHPNGHIDTYGFSVEYKGRFRLAVGNPSPVKIHACHSDPSDPNSPKLQPKMGATNGKPSVTFFADAVNGVKELLVFLASNVDLIPNGLISVVAVKQDTSKPAVVGLSITDNKGYCNILDPVFTTIEIPPGSKLVRQTLTDIPQAESHITIKNNDPGLRRLIIQTNGRMTKLVKLETDTVTVDVSAAMVKGDNTITLIGLGRPGASASILISPPQSGPDEDEQGTAARQDPAGPDERRGESLGPIALGWNLPNDEESWSAMLRDGGVDALPSPDLLGSPVSAAARLSMNALRLTTNGHLGLDAASNPANYLVEVNGITSDVRIVGYQAGTNTVLLGLAPETLRHGDTVRVSSKDFGGQIGRALAGEVRTVVTK